MTVPQKLYLDECTSVLLKEQLRQRDPQAEFFSTIDHATERVRGLSDPKQLKHSVQMSAIFVNHNIRDFYWPHRWGEALQAWDLII